MKAKDNEERILCCLMAPEYSNFFGALQEEDFFYPDCRGLFNILLEQHEKEHHTEFEELVEEFEKIEPNEDRAFNFVNDVMYKLGTPNHIERYIEQQHNTVKRRKLLHLCQSAQEQAIETGNDISDILSETERTIADISKQKEDLNLKHYKEALKGALMDIEGIIQGKVESVGYETGFINLNRLTTLRRGEMIVLGARPSIGKCFGIDTPILMYGGNIKMCQDVKEGDLLTGPDGLPRKVEALSRGREMLWKVKPYKGMEYVVNESHTLSFKLNSDGTTWAKIYNNKKYYPGDTVNLTVNQYQELCGRKKHHVKGWKSEEIKFTPKFTPIELPYYALGVWLGDGNSNKPEIYTPEPEIEDYLDKFANSIGCILTEKQQRGCKALYISTGRTGGRVKNPFMQALKRYDLLGNKHIPHDYLAGSIKNRLELLAGLLDTDGYYNKAGLYEIITKYENLKDGIVFLCHSLGLRACSKLVTKGIKSTGFKAEYYRINITGDVAKIPIKVARKKATGYAPQRNVNTSAIKLESIGEGDYYGWSIAGPCKLFLLGDFTVTHNSAFAGCLAKNLSNMGVNTYLATLEMKAEDFLRRLVFADLGANQYTIKKMSRGELEHKLIEIADKAKDSKIWFDDVGRDWAGIKRRIRRAVKTVGIQVAIIDYLQLIQITAPKDAPFFSRENQVATISGEIKALALELDIVIVILAQLGRQTEGKEPHMSDLRESGAIEQDADQVWLLHRDRETDREDLRNAERIESVIKIPKNRNGRTGEAGLWFYPGTTEFKDIKPEW